MRSHSKMKQRNLVYSTTWDNQCSSVQLLSHVQLFATSWTVARQASLSSTISQSLLKFMAFELLILSNHLILCHPLLLPSVFPSIGVFSNESALGIRWPRFWSFNFSINSSNEYWVLISFRVDWFNILAVQGTLKSLLQHHDLTASIFWLSLWSSSHVHTWLLDYMYTCLQMLVHIILVTLLK